MVLVPTIKLNNGTKIPAIGLGTWQAEEGEAEAAIKAAITMGYRHIDTALVYYNEEEVGRGIQAKIADGTVKREDLYIVTKLWNNFHQIQDVVPECKAALKRLNLDYIDLYLIHWPVAYKPLEGFDIKSPHEKVVGLDYDYVHTWKGMENCVKLGLVKSIGISNFTIKQTKRILDNCTIKPVMNQIEVSPSINQKKLIEYCQEHDVDVTAYSPFGSPTRPWAKPEDPVFSLTDKRILAIAKKHSKTSGQVVLRYLIQAGCIAIPKSSNPKRMQDNLEIFDFELDLPEVAILDSFNVGGRAVPAEYMKGMPHYPFEDDA